MNKFFSRYNYVRRCLGNVVDAVVVDVVDTSVDNIKNNVSVMSAAPAQSFYTNSDVPVSLFGNGILSTAYDPNRHRGYFDSQATAKQTAAAAPTVDAQSSQVVANTASVTTSQSNVNA